MASAALYPFLVAMVVVVSTVMTNDEVKLCGAGAKSRPRPIAEFAYLFGSRRQTAADTADLLI